MNWNGFLQGAAEAGFRATRPPPIGFVWLLIVLLIVIWLVSR